MDARGPRARRGSRLLVRLAAVALTAAPVLAVGGLAPAAAQPGPDLDVRLVPGRVTLVPGDTTAVDLVVTNRSSAPATVTSVELRTPPRVVGERVPRPEVIGTVGAGDVARVTFALRALGGVEEGEADVVLEVVGAGGTGRRVLVATLTVAAGKAPQMLDVAFLSSPKALNDRERAVAIVQVSNPTPFAFEDVRVAPVDSEDVRLRPRTHRLGTLEPGTTALVVLDVRVDGRVRTGPQQVGVVVSGHLAGSAGALRTQRVATAALDVSVFGLDAVSPLGAGTLFLLPGLVAVATFLLLSRRVYPRLASLPDTVEFKDPRTMVVVVPAGAVLYLGMFLVWGIDLTTEVGTWDVARLFGFATLLGTAAWAVLAVVYHRRTDRKQFRLDDTPAKVLERLAARSAGVRLPALSAGDRSRRYLADGPGDTVVACSVIDYHVAPTAPEEARSQLAAAIEAGDPGAVLGCARLGTATLRWRLPSGVALLPRPAEPLGPREPLLVEE